MKTSRLAKKKIEHSDTISFFLCYCPLAGKYNKMVIDRYTGEYISYDMDEN